MATTDKYDRQLRLWGAQGQRALGDTRVISVGTSSAGTETLKNLVLPGVGAFTVMDFVVEIDVDIDVDIDVNVDDDVEDGGDRCSSPSSVVMMTGKITDQDATSNFFLPKEKDANAATAAGGLTKAEGACKYLKELNPDVSGSYRNLSLTTATGITGTGGPDTSKYWKDIFEEESKRETRSETENDSNNNDANDNDTNNKKKKKKLLVIAADVLPSILEALADACHETGHPLIVVTSYGLIGSVRLQLPKEGAILLQPKPTNSPPDLRLVTSFPKFRQFVDSIAGSSSDGNDDGNDGNDGNLLEKLDGQQHGHIPYPVLLTKAMDRYQEAKSKEKEMDSNDNNNNNNNKRILPKTFAEKQDFVNNYVKPMARDYDKELNFQEAVSNAYLAYTERDLSILNDDIITTTTPTTKLGQLRSALEIFIKEHPDQRPPLNGSVPDMTASTDLYVRLQQLYKDQAEEDLQKMTEIVRRQQEQQQQQQQELMVVTDEDIANFCANVYSVGHVKTRTLREEYQESSTTNNNDIEEEEEELVDDWKMALMDPYEVPVHTPLLWYLGLRAAQIFCHREGRYPGCVVACSSNNDSNNNDNEIALIEKDAVLLTEIMNDTVIPHYKLSDQELLSSSSKNNNNNNVDLICKELTRYGNAEIHTIASVVGGVASQEAVKIVTGQYVPLDNTYVFNGIVSVGGVYKF